MLPNAICSQLLCSTCRALPAGQQEPGSGFELATAVCSFPAFAAETARLCVRAAVVLPASPCGSCRGPCGRCRRSAVRAAAAGWERSCSQGCGWARARAAGSPGAQTPSGCCGCRGQATLRGIWRSESVVRDGFLEAPPGFVVSALTAVCPQTFLLPNCLLGGCFAAFM